jgi:hypothetical protein
MVINMRYAIIENHLVTNVVIADEQTAATNGWVPCPNAGPGWGYIDGVFTEPTPMLEQIVKPTKEELLLQIQALQQQVLNLSE